MSGDTNLVTSPTLIDGLRGRDDASWSRFLRLYDLLLRAYVGDCDRRYNFRLSDADQADIRQDTLVNLLRSLPSFDLDRNGKGRFRTWLWTVVHNATIDWVRRHRRRFKGRKGQAAGADDPRPIVVVTADDLDGIAVDPGLAPDEEAVQRDLELLVQGILAQVKEEMQSAKKWDCFERHYLQKKPSAVVAAELGVSVSAVNTYTSRVWARVCELCRHCDVELEPSKAQARSAAERVE
jgi:RNA polymerase sigma factor (sigma-70 family)